jgi:hypothetical protein
MPVSPYSILREGVVDFVWDILQRLQDVINQWFLSYNVHSIDTVEPERETLSQLFDEEMRKGFIEDLFGLSFVYK